MKNIKALLILLGILLSIAACRPSNVHPEPAKPVFKQTEVNLGTHKLQAFSVIKNSEYLVVFEAGMGDDHSIWNSSNVALTIAAKTDIVTYDRASHGQSQRGPDPRDIVRLQSELGFVIDAFADGRKVVLIGHSLGGFIIRDWAIKNPTRVAGLVFVDPSHEDCSQLTQADQDAFYNSWLTAWGPTNGGTLEAKEFKNDVDYMGTVGDLPDVPVVVLTAMSVDASYSAAFRQVWYAAHESLKSGVTDFTHVSIPNSGHMVMVDQPQILINSINAFLAKLP